MKVEIQTEELRKAVPHRIDFVMPQHEPFLYRLGLSLCRAAGPSRNMRGVLRHTIQ